MKKTFRLFSLLNTGKRVIKSSPKCLCLSAKILCVPTKDRSNRNKGSTRACSSRRSQTEAPDAAPTVSAVSSPDAVPTVPAVSSPDATSTLDECDIPKLLFNSNDWVPLYNSKIEYKLDDEALFLDPKTKEPLDIELVDAFGPGKKYIDRGETLIFPLMKPTEVKDLKGAEVMDIHNPNNSYQVQRIVSIHNLSQTDNLMRFLTYSQMEIKRLFEFVNASFQINLVTGAVYFSAKFQVSNMASSISDDGSVDEFYRNIKITRRYKFDFVIIGAGSAGSVVANKLSKDPTNSVLLVEEGIVKSNSIIDDIKCLLINSITSFLLLLIGGYSTNIYKVMDNVKYGLNYIDPDYEITKYYENALYNATGNRYIRSLRGKVVGGCNSINGMVASVGNSYDYDNWARITGEPEWSWNGTIYPIHLPDFFKHVPIRRNKEEDAFNRELKQAILPLGFDATQKQDEDGLYHRATSFSQYVDTISRTRENLSIFVKHKAMRIHFDTSVSPVRAIGVYLKDLSNDDYLNIPINPAFLYSLEFVAPTSSGFIAIEKLRPNFEFHEKPLLRIDHISNPIEMEYIMDAIESCRAIEKNLVELGIVAEHGIRLGGINLGERDSKVLEQQVRDNILTAYHPHGSLRMGPYYDSSFPTTGQLRLKGSANIRVVDASVIPISPSGNTNIPSIIVGLQGSRFILRDLEIRKASQQSSSSSSSDLFKNFEKT
ncbi:hypothetical protein PPL_06354 [Heterostelium album PN500]|uniref:Uncharacterized protein n=1 Tax=Heterostelium pallidum (strain ATCC 26659 / Pp 5 / PN500) TaxID=670386 RepID=D3BCX6_HETP5|nr:hypothetical protein PPL_06354 [Heterostelium album PN500]EFA80768.1 hypothetical protein PPL_06354 [Heterostelium album PN500]|eukprot:XP_020432887.1 hypothetical protein PPL_06354 [Heterostelium album PN500]